MTYRLVESLFCRFRSNSFKFRRTTTKKWPLTSGQLRNGPLKLRRFATYAGLLSSFGLSKVGEDGTRHHIEETIKRAIYNQQEGDPKKAEQQLHLALKMAQETLDSEAITYIYDMMANLAVEDGRLDEAERLFQETTKRLVQNGTTTDDDSIIEISVKLAEIYAMKGKTEEAETGFVYCIENLQKKMESGIKDENTIMLWAMCEDSYGRFLMEVGRFKEARIHFELAFDVCQRVNGPMHPQTLVLINNLGSSSYMSGEYAAAVDHLKNAANIAKVTGSSDLSAYYRNLGMIYLQMGQVKQAENACRQAKDTASKHSDFEREAKECLEDVALSKKRLLQ